MPAGDDAGVFLLDDGTALVQTVDVFSPSVDDPYLFGQVAAANSLSDVYAMGGRPLTALSIVGFPVRTVDDGMMGDILRGGIDKMAEAGVPVVGGHSIKDGEIKAGFAVTGLVDPGKMVTNAGARPGDLLVLTKPIGTGIVAFAAQIGRAATEAIAAAADSMTTLNKAASELMLHAGAHACTDVTGFSLVGHLTEMALASGVDVELVWDDVPLFPGVLECAAAGMLSGGVERNREAFAGRVDGGDGFDAVMLDVCLDPQTSGGLLVALAEQDARGFVEQLHAAGVRAAAVVGKVVGAGSGRVALRSRGERPIPDAAERVAGSEEVAVTAETSGECCCPEEGGIESATAGGTDVRGKFLDFLKSAGAPGALDAHTKQALAVALSVLSKCGPCTATHIKKARAMGFSQEEIDEAAWMAIAFGGSPVMMFYNEYKDG
jgi:selenide,water dikinase